ncbi:MAG: anthranilate phosphoribosyltransferase [Caldilineales bacterium]|nr:anthranilate phosphoribosyltransferase [Caldilineales bacterium]MDW8317316.1 anthranilate phosphoribosyltransferase [Anaerolineae bacterium]
MIQQAIAKLLDRRDLTEDEAYATMMQIMQGEATPAQIGGFLVALRMKGETVAEIAGCARAMRDNAIPVRPQRGHPPDAPLTDIVGTGGDHSGTFNISTTAAFVVAGAGVPVAKHGNRSVTSKAGSADVLAALGVRLDLSPAQVAQCIDEAGIGFLFAVNHHPAMRHAIGPRRELAVRTVFNILGPLTNPAGATHLAIGVFNPDLTEPLAHVLGRLGAQAAFVLHGYGGLDELSLAGPNRVSALRDGRVTTFTLDPADLGLPRADLSALKGGDAAENAAITRRILSGQEQGPKRDAVLLNAAAGLALVDGDWQAALARARASLDSGAALAALERLVEVSHR